MKGRFSGANKRSFSSFSVLTMFALCLVELLLLTKFKGAFGVYLSPVFVLFAGIGISILPFFITRSKEKPPEIIRHFTLSNLLTVSLLLLSIYLFYNLVNSIPLDVEKSDVIPTINDVYIERFINHEDVYAPAYNQSNSVFSTPNYLTFHWFPFLITYALGIDHRWLAYSFFMIVLLIVLYLMIVQNKSSQNQSIVKILSCFSIPVLFLLYNEGTFVYTIEPLIAGYYILLFYALLKDNLWLIILTLSLVCLSRYSIVFVLPFIIINQYLDDKKRSVILVGSLLLGALLFYIWPFLSFDLTTFFEGLKGYDIAAIGEWEGQNWQKPADRPIQLFRGLGFASYFYDYYPGTLLDKFYASKNTFIAVSFISGLLPVLFIRKLRALMQSNLLNLVVIKFYFSFFYSFIIVPYDYLYLIPTLLSFIIFVTVYSRRVA